MYDPMIQELFPEKQSVPLSEKYALNLDLSIIGAYSCPADFGTSVINFQTGDYSLSRSLSHYIAYVFPSSFAQKTLLYLQLLSSETNPKTHYTKRKDLPSYLCTQTFYGKAKLLYEGKEYHLEKDDVFLIDCRKEHEYSADSEEGWGYRIIHFDGFSMPGYYERILEGGSVKFHFEADSRFQNLFKELFMIHEKNNANREVIENRILVDMVTEILCRLPQYNLNTLPSTIKRQQAYIQEHCREKLSLEQVATEFNLSKYYISREFKKYTGTTIYSYILECRLTIAQRLLRYSDMPVTDIAGYIGFDDHHGLYRAFRQREGMSPAEYRQRWKGI
ncbi:MAG: AraC family transcriptional regulator [Lachnospiraceae bacterium]|nr:AraC family transcriptional regulator [Lachnospiraceae bacterium]